MARRAWPWIVAPVVLALACSAPPVGHGGSGGEPVACTGDLASLEVTVFQPSCATAGCHRGGGTAAAGLDLSADVAAAVVSVPASTCAGKTLVVPGSPSTSYLFEKISSSQPTCGGPMPAVALSAERIACVEQWIQHLPQPDAGGCERCGGEACVDLSADSSHCGACDHACPAGATCGAGACTCGGALSLCDDHCVNTEADLSHCGACGHACPTGASCSAGKCACPPGFTDCGGACVDTASNGGHCGACGHACAGGTVCLAGECALDCGSLHLCGSSCVDLSTNVASCGACDHACPVGASCAGGACACPPGFAECGGVCVDVGADPTHCGDCTTVCSGGRTCQSGACACPTGKAACGGACVDLATDATHCGDCATQCYGGQVCQGGSCACPAGLALCKGSCSDLDSDPWNCGGCDVACAVGQTCQAGTCACGTRSVSFANDVLPVFSTCATVNCHTGALPAGNLLLDSAAARSQLVGVTTTLCADGRRRVVPGDPRASYLVNKMMGVDLCFGFQMPSTFSTIQVVTDWICEGAPDN